MTRLVRLNPRRIWRTLQMVEPLRQQTARQHKELLRELEAMRKAAEESREQLERALAAHEKTLAGLPELRARVDRCMAVYQDDAQSADRIAAFHARVDLEAVKAHVRRAIASARLEREPYPYLVVEHLFPDDVFDTFVEALPSPVFFDKVAEQRDEIMVPFPFAPAYHRLVWSVFQDGIEQAMLPALLETFRPALDDFVRTTWPSLGSWPESGLTLRAANSRLMLRRRGYVIKPHRDPRWSFLTALVYLAPRDAPQAYGTQLYRLTIERDAGHSSPFWPNLDECELVRDVPGVGNTALVFLNSTGAHGAVVPKTAPADYLRYIYQARFSPDAASKARLVELLETDARPRWVVAL